MGDSTDGGLLLFHVHNRPEESIVAANNVPRVFQHLCAPALSAVKR
ncbi:hypothetical protein CFter6_0287 [Collimonas fungivorans]|uniref:Uncharacterized protein n=1 Tax=Collimonas fungivorans TaxID=158899 RepID=A0A127P5L2_9BURK|nr:hypothetical protein CFter6_0287 [Collimonas fungivorans]